MSLIQMKYNNNKYKLNKQLNIKQIVLIPKI